MIDYIWIITVRTPGDLSYSFHPLMSFCFTSKDEAIRYLKDLDHPGMETECDNKYLDEQGNAFYLCKLKVLDRW